MGRLVVALLSLLGSACGTELELAIDLQTDLEPGVDFTTIRTRLASRPMESESWETPDVVALLEGARVAEYRGLVPGEDEVTIELLDADGALVAGRTEAVVFAEENRGLRFVFEQRPRILTGEGTSCLWRMGRLTCWGAAQRLVEGADTGEAIPPTARDGLVRDACFSGAEGCFLDYEGELSCYAGNEEMASRVVRAQHPGARRVVCGATFVSIHRCLLFEDGTVGCNGTDDVGLLGDGEGRSEPVSFGDIAAVSLPDVRAIDAGFAHTCAIAGGGAVHCWGFNNNGQLGDGALDSRFVPFEVGVSDATGIAAGNVATCAVTRSGATWCWGSNVDGAIGPGAPDPVLAPTEAPRAAGARDVTVGNGHVCTRDADGAVACWGSNASGELGDGTFTARTEPAEVTLPGAALALSSETNHACVIVAGEAPRVLCWGANALGQLGVTGGRRNAPIEVPLP